VKLDNNQEVDCFDLEAVLCSRRDEYFRGVGHAFNTRTKHGTRSVRLTRDLTLDRPSLVFHFTIICTNKSMYVLLG